VCGHSLRSLLQHRTACHMSAESPTQLKFSQQADSEPGGHKRSVRSPGERVSGPCDGIPKFVGCGKADQVVCWEGSRHGSVKGELSFTTGILGAGQGG
jgi:hypothetical protein